jgi:hypothetical protein
MISVAERWPRRQTLVVLGGSIFPIRPDCLLDALEASVDLGASEHGTQSATGAAHENAQRH